MEEQLAAYRAKKAKERTSHSDGFFGLLSHKRKRESSQNHSESEKMEDVSSSSLVDENLDSTGLRRDKSNVNAKDTKTDVRPQSFSTKPYSTSKFDPKQLALKIILWLSLFGLFVCIGFGAVFIILSLFYIIYANLRGESEKTPGEKSAYSVFNPDCERIHGTLTAEEIEKGMLYGIGGAMR